MTTRRMTVLVAVAAMFASSIIGSTALRTTGARATDLVTVGDVVDQAREELDSVTETVLTPVGSNLGAGETLVLVVAEQAPMVSEAESLLSEVNGRLGHLQGFYVDGAEHYEVVGAFLQVSPDTLVVPCLEDHHCPEGVTTVEEFQPVVLQHTALDALAQTGLTGPLADLVGTELTLDTGLSLVLSGFRTKRGAEEFVELVRAAGIGPVTIVQARKIGGGDIGLGQEPHPDGSGPLLGPLPDQESYQR